MLVKEIANRLKTVVPFCSFKRRQLMSFAAISEVKDYSTGETVYSEGDKPDYFYLILKGRAVAVTNIDGQEKQIECIKRGVAFGIISVLTDDVHSVTIKTIEDSLILRVEKALFKDFIRKYPEILLAFTKILSSRVKKRSHPKEIFQSTRVGICDFSDSGSYAFDLSAKLKKNTGRKVIYVEFFTDSCGENNKNIQGVRVLALSDFLDEEWRNWLKSEEVDLLRVRIDSERNFAALFNSLSESYHYIVTTVEPEVCEKYASSLGKFMHYIHFFLPLDKKTVYDNMRSMNKVKVTLRSRVDKVKMIVSDCGKANIRVTERRKNIPFPVRIMLPAEKNSNYWRAIDALCREISNLSIGVALGSGAAYGYSHIGVIKELDAQGVAVDLISGTSMGALIAALWAAGYPLEKIRECAIEFGAVISKYPLWQLAIPFKGILKAHRLEKLLKNIFGELTFYELKYPLRVVAFNFLKREIRIFDSGLVYKAVAASCAMPAIFEPIKIDGQMFFDGGILSPLPIYPLIEAGINRIIAVNITPSREEMSKEYKRRRKLSIFDFIFGSIETMQQEFINHELRMADIIIHPDLSGLGWMEFNKADEFILRGEKAIRKQIAGIKSTCTTGSMQV
ncbi:MAG: patatin-like phospholipase family protein [Candidatus Omnitrophica bacterium]|nr:patatin-like phospholipase family protein [Candidatus Omnitrophota bacterium]